MELLNTIFSGPLLPASAFLGLMLVWSLLAILGAVDLDLPGADAGTPGDMDADLEAAAASAGAGLLAAKWLNIIRVPLVLWLGVFAVVWWLTSALSWILLESNFFASPGWLWSAILVAKNLVIALAVTKLITAPMCNWFADEKLSAASLVGRECRISSSEATPTFGLVKLKTDGSPLLLNVRTDGPHLAQGAEVWITHYDAKRRVYIVSPTTTPEHALENPESSSPSL